MHNESSTRTFGLIPLKTVLRSLNSTSFCLIFFTTSKSWESGTYLRLAGVAAEDSTARVRGVAGSACPPVTLGGVPGGVVESAIDIISRKRCEFQTKRTCKRRYSVVV